MEWVVDGFAPGGKIGAIVSEDFGEFGINRQVGHFTGIFV